MIHNFSDLVHVQTTLKGVDITWKKLWLINDHVVYI